MRSTGQIRGTRPAGEGPVVADAAGGNLQLDLPRRSTICFSSPSFHQGRGNLGRGFKSHHAENGIFFLLAGKKNFWGWFIFFFFFTFWGRGPFFF